MASAAQISQPTPTLANAPVEVQRLDLFESSSVGLRHAGKHEVEGQKRDTAMHVVGAANAYEAKKNGVTGKGSARCDPATCPPQHAA